MRHPGYRIEIFEIVGPFTLLLRFNDGVEQRIDFRPVLEGELFGPLRNEDIFNSVALDQSIGTVVWPNGADFDPATLHDWPKHRDQLIAMAHDWENRTKVA